MKRQRAPNFWDIKRKQSQFVVNIEPGPHPKHRAYPLGMVLRDLLHVAETMREAKLILNAGKVKIDGVTRYDDDFAIGLMDVIELGSGQAFRMVPSGSRLLVPLAIDESEKSLKLAKVTSKITTLGKKLQLGFHDGRTIVGPDPAIRVGDTCVIKLPEGQIDRRIEFATGSTALIISGENAGKIGKIEDIRDGIFSLPKRVLISFEERSVELPVEMVMIIGTDKPILRVS